MIPDWLQQLTTDFGLRLGLPQLTFNDRDTAGFRTENGFSFQLEYRAEHLYMILVFPMSGSMDNLEKLLEMVHPEQRLPYAVHAAFKPSPGGMFIIAARERELTVPELMARFECLWKLATAASSRLG